MSAKVLPDSIKQATDGRVECSILDGDKTYTGTIENMFFQEATGSSDIPIEQKLELTKQSLSFIEHLASIQIRMGRKSVVIR